MVFPSLCAARLNNLSPIHGGLRLLRIDGFRGLEKFWVLGGDCRKRGENLA